MLSANAGYKFALTLRAAPVRDSTMRAAMTLPAAA